MSAVSRLRLWLANVLAPPGRRRARTPARLAPRPMLDEWQAVETPLAGLIFHEGGQSALDLGILEKVSLRREPQNPHDANAVAVVTHDGHPVGYLPKDLARRVGPALDAGRAEPTGIVTELRSNTAGTAIGVRITFGVHNDVLSSSSTDIEFCCEEGEAGTTYLLLTCDAVALDTIHEGLSGRGLSCERSGQSFRHPTDGHAYQWYLRMSEGVTPEAVVEYFAEVHKVSPWAPPSRAVDEYVEGFGEELITKDARIATLERLLSAEKEHIRQAEHGRRGAETSALQRLVSSVFPNVTFLRGSWDVLATEIQQPGNVLRDLFQIAFSQNGIAAAPVRGAPGWKEIHFSTGQRDDGRLYFRRSGGQIEALVSFKREQERDIQYLDKQ